MTFSNDDLKRLKEDIKEHRKKYETQDDYREKFCPFPHHWHNIDALLARLEATEKFINESFMPIEWEDHPNYKAWRKSCGKAEE